MRNVRTVCLSVVVVLAISGIAAASASAEEFIASKSGELVGKSLTSITFKTGKVPSECTNGTMGGPVGGGHQTGLSLGGTLEKCTNPLAGPVKVSPVHVGITIAPSKAFKIEESNILIDMPAIGCTVKIFSGQTRGEKAGELEYINKSGKLEEKYKITGLHYAVLNEESSVCLTGTEEGTEGTFSGNYEVELPGGTIEVK